MSIPRKLPIRVRSINEEDLNFVFNSWLKSYRTSQTVKHIDNNIYFQNQHKLVQQCLLNSQTLVACDENDVSQILGYLVFDRIDGIFTIHYAYIKQPFRGLGIFNLLLEEAGHDYKKTAGIFTHATEIAIKNCKYFNLVYHPYVTELYIRKQGQKELLAAQEKQAMKVSEELNKKEE